LVRLPTGDTSLMTEYHHRMKLSRVVPTTSYDVGMDDDGRGFGLWLANELDRKDWQQSDLVERMSVKAGVVSAWINGKRKPSYENCLIIARILRVEPNEVLVRAGRPTVNGPRPRQLVLLSLDGSEEYEVAAIVAYVEARPGRLFQEELRAVREERSPEEYTEFCLDMFRAWESNSNFGVKTFRRGQGTGTIGL
jgi:transcriptional regulator with XRE-family HTH domain